MKVYHQKAAILLGLALIWAAACSTISRFSPQAYENATSLKVESLNMMDQATQPFPRHAEAVNALKIKVEKAYEYANGLPKNEISTKQWFILKNPEGGLLGGFLVQWEKDTTLSQVFIDDVKELVSDAFDSIIGLESGKIKSGDSN